MAEGPGKLLKIVMHRIFHNFFRKIFYLPDRYYRRETNGEEESYKEEAS